MINFLSRKNPIYIWFKCQQIHNLLIRVTNSDEIAGNIISPVMS